MFRIILALWYVGMAISVTCLIIQVLFYSLLPASRRTDQRILTQLTVARFLNIAFEYGSLYESENTPLTCVIVLMYFHSDAALVCWMSIFTKRLYDKLVVVFAEDMNYLCLSVSVWLCTLPVGLVSSGLLFASAPLIFKFCSVYCIVKCVILAFNLIVFCRIFWVIATVRADRNLKKMFRTCVNCFLLVSVTSLQIFNRFFYTDNTPFFVPSESNNKRNSFLILFGVLSCYQSMAITLIFVLFLNAANKSDKSLIEQIVIKLKR